MKRDGRLAPEGAGSEQPAQWTGELVSRGYATHSRLSAGDRRPLPVGPYSGYDVRRVSDYRVTYEGRTQADRVRRERREELTDVALGGVVPNLLQPWMSEVQRRAVRTPLPQLRAALDNEQFVAAVGAATDLMEAACKVAIEPCPRDCETWVRRPPQRSGGESAAWKKA